MADGWGASSEVPFLTADSELYEPRLRQWVVDFTWNTKSITGYPAHAHHLLTSALTSWYAAGASAICIVMVCPALPLSKIVSA